MQTTVISTTATRATRTPMAAPSAVLLILIVLSSCEVVVGDTLSAGDVTLPVEVVVAVSVNGDVLSIVMMVEVVVCVNT